jgi:hypothetical protein
MRWQVKALLDLAVREGWTNDTVGSDGFYPPNGASYPRFYDDRIYMNDIFDRITFVTDDEKEYARKAYRTLSHLLDERRNKAALAKADQYLSARQSPANRV